MKPINQELLDEAVKLAQKAWEAGFVIEFKQVARHPLAMGNYHIDVRVIPSNPNYRGYFQWAEK